ncbi:hypothetical protein AB0G60_01850 [Streptomyces angustmyceticus]|uniref:Gram-positive cocci surface proteins LPxTG domain-containing protein n=1 Tax=Streptomyces angustmyceticus TaxID=285578 RepID=A0A5J4L8A2_9ACTN|nr:hypothetical protein [Streptomyces angustmyceticus]UAL65420.1 hypothetical protein K7396_01845 [Streptomyces angustmyceticus]GES28081.1 hypothetical protein San01_05680 [Streptomyces angustmyceticus]
MAAPFAPGPFGRLCRGALLVALLTAVCAATGPARAVGGAAGTEERTGTGPSVTPMRCAFPDTTARDAAAGQPRHAGSGVVAPAGPLRALPEESARISGLRQSVPGPVAPAGHPAGRSAPSRSADGSGGPVRYPLPGPFRRLCAAGVPLTTADVPADAQRPGSATALTSKPAAKPAQAATGTKPLVFMGFGTMAGLTLLAGAGLVSGARRRRGSGPPPGRC